MSAPVLTRNLREQIVQQLRSEIVSGRLEAGEPLREVELARRFGVSRGPIRDALLQLTCEGAAIARANCGVFVAPDTADAEMTSRLVIPLRRRVEGFALRKVFSDLKKEDFARWDALLHKMRLACEERDLAGIAEFDLAFHRSIVERAGNLELTAIWSSLVTGLRRHFRQTYRAYENPVDVYVEHAALVEIFRRGPLRDALRALKRNIA